MHIARRNFLKAATAALAIVSVAPAVLLEGCTSQATIASLINTLGGAAEQLATVENNPTLAAKLQTDVAAASAAVLNWKKGSAGTMVVEALNLVEDDLNLFPFAGPYVPLIDLAIGTIEAILAELGLTSAPAAAAKPRRSVVLSYKAPKNSKAFTAKWNALAPPTLQLAK
jgi:hypothetical protein